MEFLISEQIHEALDIVDNAIIKITNQFAVEEDIKKAEKLKAKINLLTQYRDQVRNENINIVNQILEEHQKGVL